MFTALRKNIASLLTAVTIVVVPVVAPIAVLADGTTTNNIADIQNCLAGGTTLQITAGGTCANAADTTKSGADNVNHIITVMVNIFSAIVGVIAVIMIIYGGVKYITSGGDSGNVGSAKNTIIYAVIGLVVVALAQFIVQFVLNKVNNTATTTGA